MPITTEIDKDRNLRVHIISGILTYKKLIEKLQELYASSEQIMYMNVLWDISEADVSSFTTAEVESVAKLVNENWGASGNNKGAFVASGALGYGLTRMFEILLEHGTKNQISVFRNRKEAEEWLLEE